MNASDNAHTLQEAGQRLVRQEIQLCVSSLVYGLTKHAHEFSREAAEDIGLDEDVASDLWSRPVSVDDYRDAAPSTIRVDEEDGDWRWSVYSRSVDPEFPRADLVDVLEDEGTADSELEAWREAFNAAGEDEPEPSEIFEHWAVSDWLGRKLSERGERVVEDVLGGLTIWGRPTTGQAIYMDSVIEEIAREFYLARPLGDVLGTEG